MSDDENSSRTSAFSNSEPLRQSRRIRGQQPPTSQPEILFLPGSQTTSQGLTHPFCTSSISPSISSVSSFTMATCVTSATSTITTPVSQPNFIPISTTSSSSSVWDTLTSAFSTVSSSNSHTTSVTIPSFTTAQTHPPPFTYVFRSPQITPDTFSGTEDVEKFFENLEAAIAVNHWEKRTVPLFIQKFLVREALSYFNLLKDSHSPLTFELLKNKFLSQFSDKNKKQKYEIELQNLTLTENNSLLDYIFKVKNLCFKINNKMSEDSIIFHIFKGLPTSIKSILTLYPHATLSEFDASVKKFQLRDFEMSAKLPAQSAQKTTEPTISEPLITELIQKIELQEEKILKLRAELDSNNKLKNSKPSKFSKRKNNERDSRQNWQHPQQPPMYNPNVYNQPPPPPPHNQGHQNQNNPPSYDICSVCDGKHPTAACNLQFCRYCKSVGHKITSCPHPKCKISQNLG